MTTTLRLPPRIARLPQLRQIVRGGLEARGSIGAGLAAKAGGAAAAPWYLAGGAPTPIAVYQPKGAASLAASYINLVNPGTYDAAPGVAPTFDAATGWTFNGSTQYLISGLSNTTSWSALVQFSDVPGENINLFLFGAYSGSGHFGIVPILGTGGNHSRYFINGGDLAVANKILAGNMAIAGNAAYLNGITDGTIGGGGAPGGTLYIGARHRIDTGGVDSYVTAKMQALVFWDTSTNHAAWMPVVMGACALI